MWNDKGEWFNNDCMPSITYTITTDIDNGAIIQRLLDEHQNELSRWIMNTREQQIKQALIKLGWIPPIEERIQDDKN